MILEELHLEITRNCSLYCEHCLRGDKQCVNMSLDTLDNLFADINQINSLLLTGGEPLIAIAQLERLAEIIKSKGIKIGVIKLITNGTIMSARVLNVLKELKSLAEFDMRVSANIFHILELERLGFTELRNKNFEILRDYLEAEEYGVEEREDTKLQINQMIISSGRAKRLTHERLEEINKLVSAPYVTSESVGIPRDTGKLVYLIGPIVGGQVTFDVNGNIVGYGLEFEEEDIDAKEIKANVNAMSLRDCVRKYIDYKEANLSDRERKLRKIMFI